MNKLEQLKYYQEILRKDEPVNTFNPWAFIFNSFYYFLQYPHATFRQPQNSNARALLHTGDSSSSAFPRGSTKNSGETPSVTAS